MGRQTPLFRLHQELGARIVDFGGWDMPVQYGSQIGEHHAVRRAAGVFDVSHMCVIDLTGERVRAFLRHLLANDVAKLTLPGKALYSCLLQEDGGILDDLIVYYLREDWFRVVVNAGTRDKDLAWIRRHAQPFGVQVSERADLAMLAVQGPEARAKAAQLLAPAEAAAVLALDVFVGQEVGSWFVARTGYTGEDGFEIMMPAADAIPAWRSLNSLGVASCGLGARDTLRLEAGMNLYGNDMDESYPAVRIRSCLDGRAQAPRACLHRPAGSRGDRQGRLAAQARGTAARGPRRAARSPEGHRRRRRRGRDHERHVLPDARALDRLRARARGERRRRAGGYPRQAFERARGEAAVRALRPILDYLAKGSKHE